MGRARVLAEGRNDSAGPSLCEMADTKAAGITSGYLEQRRARARTHAYFLNSLQRQIDFPSQSSQGLKFLPSQNCGKSSQRRISGLAAL